MKNQHHQNIIWHSGNVSINDRLKFLNQQPLTIWLTGLSASGKSTLAFALERSLLNMGKSCYVLDGDNIRHGLNKNLGFSVEDRSENIRRIAEVAKLMNDAGLIVVTAFISPMLSDRKMARDIIGNDYFREIYVNTPINTCEARDPKGLYAKARSGKLREFTGVSATYEPPINASLTIDTSKGSLEEHIAKILKIFQQTN